MQVPSRAVPLVLESLNPAVTAPAGGYSANMTLPVHAAMKPLIAGQTSPQSFEALLQGQKVPSRSSTRSWVSVSCLRVPAPEEIVRQLAYHFAFTPALCLLLHFSSGGLGFPENSCFWYPLARGLVHSSPASWNFSST